MCAAPRIQDGFVKWSQRCSTTPCQVMFPVSTGGLIRHASPPLACTGMSTCCPSAFTASIRNTAHRVPCGRAPILLPEAPKGEEGDGGPAFGILSVAEVCLGQEIVNRGDKTLFVP
mmetsp:Transcript_33415/g.78298  ORF Transcript_33415/g.78298 Transcript_33415/m.78298 type:complete len:116 (+) Transcript_33415:419-766(+)